MERNEKISCNRFDASFIRTRTRKFNIHILLPISRTHTRFLGISRIQNRKQQNNERRNERTNEKKIWTGVFALASTSTSTHYFFVFFCLAESFFFSFFALLQHTALHCTNVYVYQYEFFSALCRCYISQMHNTAQKENTQTHIILR